MSISVASITTAFNATRIISRHIDAILSQRRPLQEIIIVDNGSTDGLNNLLAARYPQVTVLRMERNLGAAGAWAAGVKYAFDKGHDWFWMFDDDSVPGESDLESLLNGAQLAGTQQDLGMVVPLPVHRETGVNYPPLLWREGFVRPPKHLLEQPIWFADLAIASGCLIRRQVVERIGLPRADFFMDFFDFEYSLRMRSQGFRIAVVTNCIFSHEIGNARRVPLPGYKGLWPDYAPWREYYVTRNMVYSAWHLYPTRKTKWFITRHLIRHAAGALLFGSNRIASLKKMFIGAGDGKRARLGIRFLPG